MKKVISVILAVGCILSITGCGLTEPMPQHRDYQPVTGTYAQDAPYGYDSSITFNSDRSFSVSENGITSSQNGFYEETDNSVIARSNDGLDTFVFEKTPDGRLRYDRSKSSYNSMNTDDFMDGEILSRRNY